MRRAAQDGIFSESIVFARPANAQQHMAKSRFEYVRTYEQDHALLPNTYIVVRIDGRGFHRFSAHYKFAKPNDRRALNLMNHAARAVMEQIPDTTAAYGQSDEYSFVLRRDCSLFDRREAKLISTFASTFTAHYQFQWKEHFPDTPLDPAMLPTFDARAVLYPSITELRDYLSWRQADCHINNLYNTSFWSLILLGTLSEQQAEQELMGTLSADKNELLFSRFGINYNNEDAMYRKGTIIVRKAEESLDVSAAPTEMSKRQLDREQKKRRKAALVEEHVDIIGEVFWSSLGKSIV
ncbi:tRNAHis guanylyltransferase-domain-containing protein [Limtongia smithiae]|uniref:tRNAHis guanylyltransferase-domain-containing protein n=1 Tax=Limtongia smithiae TaxID=1125753 RepID=UPI0034CDD4F0